MRNKIADANRTRIVNYRRTRTKNQKGNNSLKMQKESYEKDRKRYGWITVASIEEIGSGASISQRKGVREVLRLMGNHEVDGVYVTELDRLIRPENLRDLAEFYDAFVKHNIKLVTPNRIYDLNNCMDSFSFDIEGILNKYNRKSLLQHRGVDKKEVV